MPWNMFLIIKLPHINLISTLGRVDGTLDSVRNQAMQLMRIPSRSSTSGVFYWGFSFGLYNNRKSILMIILPLLVHFSKDFHRQQHLRNRFPEFGLTDLRALLEWERIV